MSLILEKATELGVIKLFLVMERSIIRIDESRFNKN